MNRSYSLSLDKITLLSIVYLLIWSTTPPMASGLIYRLLGVFCVCVIVFSGTPHCIHRQTLYFVLIIAICSITMLTGELFTYRINTVIFLCFALCSVVLDVKTVSVKTAERVITLVLLNCLIWEFFTLRTMQTIPNIMRLAMRENDIPFGTGGYGFLYTVILFCPISMDIMMDTNKPMRLRFVSLVYTLLTVYMTLKSQYFLGIILNFLSIIIFLIMRIKRNNIRMMALFMVIIATGILYFCSEPILVALLKRIDTGATYRKLQDILNMIQGNGSIEEGEFGTRFERYTRDLRLALTSPIWGALKYSSVGKHSTILDFFAQYGIPLGVLFVVSLRKRFLVDKSPVAKVLSIVFLLFCLLDPISYQMGAIFLLMPFYELTRYYKGDSNE